MIDFQTANKSRFQKFGSKIYKNGPVILQLKISTEVLNIAGKFRESVVIENIR